MRNVRGVTGHQKHITDHFICVTRDTHRHSRTGNFHYLLTCSMIYDMFPPSSHIIFNIHINLYNKSGNLGK